MVRLPDSWRFSLSASSLPENPLPTPSAKVRITREVWREMRRIRELRPGDAQWQRFCDRLTHAILFAASHDGARYPTLHNIYDALEDVCLVAEHSWDRVRWAIEECAWRFDQCTRPSRPRRS